MTDQPTDAAAPTPPPPVPEVLGYQGHPGDPAGTEALYPTAPRTNTLAVVSFVSAFFVSLAAVITGHIALAQIRARGEAGRGLAIAGLVLGYLGLAILAAVIAFAVLFAAVFGTFVSSLAGATGPSNSAPSTDVLSGTVGAAHFDDGYLELGSGPVVVDVYFDVLCPFCKAFEDTNGPQLALAVQNDAITLRLHSLTFLDRASAGTDYSSRASSALTCQATMNPDGTLDLLAALYADQPAENTAGLSNTELASLAAAAAPGGRSIADCVGSEVYQAWSQQNTERAFTGPIDATDLTMIEGTPTVLVDGLVYPGSITDPEQFNAFVSAAF